MGLATLVDTMRRRPVAWIRVGRESRGSLRVGPGLGRRDGREIVEAPPAGTIVGRGSGGYFPAVWAGAAMPARRGYRGGTQPPARVDRRSSRGPGGGLSAARPVVPGGGGSRRGAGDARHRDRQGADAGRLACGGR